MEIETKLNIGETCFFMMQNKVVSAIIDDIQVNIDNSLNQRVIYTIDKNPISTTYTKRWSEEDVFKTKEELLKTL